MTKEAIVKRIYPKYQQESLDPLWGKDWSTLWGRASEQVWRQTETQISNSVWIRINEIWGQTYPRINFQTYDYEENL